MQRHFFKSSIETVTSCLTGFQTTFVKIAAIAMGTYVNIKTGNENI